MSEADVYEKIAETFDYPGSINFIEYLKVLFTPEEGKLLLELLTPATCEQLAKRLKVDESSLYEKLEELRRRRLLFKGETEYLFHVGIHGFFARIAIAKDEDIPPGFFEAWDKFMPEVEQRMLEKMEQLQLQYSGAKIGRIIPARLAISSNPNISLEQILWYEDIHEMIRRKGEEGVIGVFDCPCRRRAQRCERPLGNCFEFGKYAEFNLKQSSRMKVVSVDEAIAISDEAERGGLLKNSAYDYAVGLGREGGGVLCNCCGCCCNVTGAVIRAGKAQQLYSPSRFRPAVDEERCIGCQECVERCFFDAIEMRKPAGSRKFKASIINDKCLGCGLCVLACEQKALIFELVRPPEHIPLKPLIPPPIPPMTSTKPVYEDLK